MVAKFRTAASIGVSLLSVGILFLAIAAPVGASTLLGAPYTGTLVLASPTSWSTGCGSVTWPTPPTPDPTGNLVTGNALSDLHATSCYPSGTWGSSNTQTGFSVGPWTPVPGTSTVTFAWALNYYLQVAENCASGTVTLDFAAIGEVLQNGILMAGSTVSSSIVSHTWASPATYYYGSGTNVPVAMVTPPLGFSATHTYEFVTWIESSVKSVCSGGVSTAVDFGEIDMAHTAPVGATLASITIS